MKTGPEILAAMLFVRVLLGHIIGDYFFQTKGMAIHKSEKGWKGFWICSIHVLIYTVSIRMMLVPFDWGVWVAIFLPHWLIDRYSLAHVWLKFIRGRTFEGALNSKSQYREFDIAFTSIVYTVVDNGAHLISMWLVLRYLVVPDLLQ